MSERERAFYRWVETFTLSPVAREDDPHLALALARGYVERVKTDTGFAVTKDGWEWFAARSAVIVTRCIAGHHEYAPKTPFCTAVHCRWCGHCE